MCVAGRYDARLGVAGSSQIYLGTFTVDVDAARCYDRSAARIKGMHAATNFAISEYARQITEHELKQLEVCVSLLSIHAVFENPLFAFSRFQSTSTQCGDFIEAYLGNTLTSALSGSSLGRKYINLRDWCEILHSIAKLSLQGSLWLYFGAWKFENLATQGLACHQLNPPTLQRTIACTAGLQAQSLSCSPLPCISWLHTHA